MRFLLLHILSLSLLVGGMTTTWAADEIAALLQKTAEKAESYKSWTADYSQSMSMMGSTMAFTGRVMFRRPQEMRMEMQMPSAMGHGGGNMVMVLGQDGVMWQDLRMGEHRQVMKIDTSQMPQAMAMSRNNPAEQMDPRKQIEMMQNNFDLSIADGQEIQGQAMHVLEGTVKESATDPQAKSLAQMFGKMRMYLGVKDGFLHKIEMFAKDGQTVAMSQEFKNLVFNAELDDDLFSFTPPDGVQVIDMSKMMQMKKSAPSGKGAGPGQGHGGGLPPGHPPID